MIRYRDLAPYAQFVLKAAAMVLVAGVVTTCSLRDAQQRMEVAAARERICRAELEALTARNLYAERYLRPADPCLALAVTVR